jgi:uncharacterized membrane protein YkvA (DUF1232 family)
MRCDLAEEERPPGSVDLDRRLSEIKPEFVEQGARKITDEDVKKVVDKADDIRDRFRKGGPLGRFVDDSKLLISIVRDYWNGEYRKIPYWSMAAIVFTLLYVFNPIDLIPDALPVLGQIDDALVVSICLLMVEQDLHVYREWKTRDSRDS